MKNRMYSSLSFVLALFYDFYCKYSLTHYTLEEAGLTPAEDVVWEVPEDPGHHGQVLQVVVGLEQRVALQVRQLSDSFVLPEQRFPGDVVFGVANSFTVKDALKYSKKWYIDY